MRVTDEMVTRFLSWSLPKDFAPDCYVSFKLPDPVLNPNPSWPVGTNLLTAVQARAMLEHVLSESAGEPLCGIGLIAAERYRQVTAEGWTTAHDDEHAQGELARAGACYAFVAADQAEGRSPPAEGSAPLISWPWDSSWWKPKDQVRNLVRAGALIAAEIDRVLREPCDPPQF